MESLVAAGRDAALRVGMAGSLRQLRQDLVRWFRERGVRSPEPAAFTLTAVIDGLLLQWMLDPDIDPEPVIAGMRMLVQHDPTRAARQGGADED